MDITVNESVVILLLSIGKFLKSTSYCKKIPNDIIPFILIGIGIICTLCIEGIDTNSILNGIMSALTAIGTHQAGKTIYNSIDNNEEEENNDGEI